MSGKSYSIREMKTIVEYLTENKLYGEIRGRKMWMDFANTQLTTRTWQSLKETFLKRILPDIHNPYYRLSIEQINSFRAGYDVSDRNKNKLEIHTISDDSNDNNQNDTQSNNDYGIKEEILAGENIKCSKIPSQNRSSADTVIVDTCYETAEDIQKDLESPGQEPETRSLRDCITYSEPLTPMLQEVLDDFQSEPENDTSDRETQMEKGNAEKNSENTNKETTEEDGKQNKSEQDVNENSSTMSKSTVVVDKDTDPKVVVNDNENPNSGTNNNIQKPVSDKTYTECDDDSVQIVESATSEKQAENDKDNAAQKEMTKKAVSVNADSEDKAVLVVRNSDSEIIHSSNGLNNSNSTVDASLPNNPEALKNKSITKNDAEVEPAKQNTDVKVTRKRSNSENTKITNNKKTRLQKTKATSESEDKRAIRTIREQKEFVGNGKTPGKIESKPDKKINETVPAKKDLNLSDNVEKPSTSKSNDFVMLSDTEQTPNLNGSSENKNPCLQNVSLYEEQFNKLKCISSESEGETNKKKETVNNSKVSEDPEKQNKVREKQNEVSEKLNEVSEKPNEVSEKQNEVSEKQNEVSEKPNEVVMLRSHSDSDTEEIPSSSKKKQRPGVISSKTERERALANVFGFSGAANAKRRRQLSRGRRTISQNNLSQNTIKTDSSEWTSELDSEGYVSPPRSRKNRQTKKYLKPQSGRILSLEEEGGLFVMYGKKIYPLVKDGKLVKNYLTYLPESDSEDDRHYWKSKYEEEKNKAEELKRLLLIAKEKSRPSTSSAGAPTLRNSVCEHNQPQEATNEGESGKEICVPTSVCEKKPEPAPITSENIKIKFTTKNDQEIHLEGKWPQLHNVLEHVVHIFHKEPQPISTGNNKTVVEPPSSNASGISTPVVITAVHEPNIDPDVHEKVNKIENEIFKEIEERDQEEKTTPVEQGNVTKRKALRPRKSSQTSSVSQSPAKKQKTSDTSVKETEIKTKNEKLTEETKSSVESPKKLGRPSKKSLNESQTDDTNTVQTRRSKLNTSRTKDSTDDADVRYMFPPKTTRQTVKSALTDKKSKDKTYKSIAKPPKIFSSPETTCSNSLESTQGYQDSDPSPMKTEFRKKKMINHSKMKYKTLSHLRRSNGKKLSHNEGDSNNSSPESIHRDNSTLNSNIYKSDSYQLLMPVAKKSFSQLDPIDETSPMGNDIQLSEQLDSTRNAIYSAGLSTAPENTCPVVSDLGSSSSVSLPMSPELSVVESLSISRELIKTMEDGPTLNEIHSNKALATPMSCNQYLISDIDVSVPLMEQECGLKGSNVMCNNNTDKQPNLVTESLLSKIGTINIADENNVTDILDVQLRDLLLESAKKIVKENRMDVDETNVEVPKKARNKKRCSTPRKRKNAKKSNEVANVPTLIEEEHTVSFAKGGRQSCPPIIQTLIPEVEEINMTSLAIDDNVKPKGRKKKDIIKVKILKPKIKKAVNDTAKSLHNSTKKSTGTDSGINDTESGVFLRGDDSVDLIHNHSETCLQAHDCIGDSLEIVEDSIKSVLTLEDSLDENLWNSHCEFLDTKNIPDLFSNNAQDVKSFYNPKPDDIECETVYHSPLGTESSLITEDLSDDLPQAQVKSDKWYLLSDEETTSTNMNTINPLDRPSNITSFGSNLKQIFPLTCAVPDLSTITEMSRDSGNSQRPTEEGATVDGLDSQNNFV